MSENNKTVSFRTTQEMIDEIAAGKEKPGDIIRQALQEFFERKKTTPVVVEELPPRVIDTVKKANKRPLTLPVGDVLMRGMGGERTELWWVSPDNIDILKSIMVRFKGCELKVGVLGRGAEYMPEVITMEWQERKRNGAFTPSCRMDEALIGDKLVWIEITDSEKALKTFETQTDIPCPIRIDVIRYSDDPAYKRACDKGNELFKYYYVNKHPLDISNSTPTATRMAELYGV